MKNDVGSVDDICVFCERGFEEGQETSRVFISLSQHDNENCVFAKVHKECSDNVRENGLGNAREVALDIIGPLVSYKKACDFLFVHIGMLFLNEYTTMTSERTLDDVSDSIERQLMFKGAANIVASMFEKSVEEVIADTFRGRSDNMAKVIDLSFLDKTLYSRLEELDDEE